MPPAAPQQGGTAQQQYGPHQGQHRPQRKAAKDGWFWEGFHPALQGGVEIWVIQSPFAQAKEVRAGGVRIRAQGINHLVPAVRPLAQAVEEWLSAGKTIVVMTQVPYEGSDMSVYQVGQQVKERFQLMEAYNMTLEAAATKLMWVLGQTGDPARVRELFYRPVQFDVIQ